MKRKILSFMLSFVCIVSALGLTACGNKEPWTFPKRISLSLPDKVHVEYQNSPIGGSASLPGYCVLVKEGDLYYVKTPHKNYSSNRLEVFVKANLQNGVVLDEPQYAQGHISARWSDYTNSWISAADDSGTSPNAPEWHANDQNGSVYYTGIGFLNVGYGDVNHIYENGVANEKGYKFTATQLENETLTLESGQQVDCIVWEYEEYFAEDNWGKEKFWFDAETDITIKKTSIYPSSANQDLNADENVGFKATYFSKNETMEEYLSSIERLPLPDFSDYN